MESAPAAEKKSRHIKFRAWAKAAKRMTRGLFAMTSEFDTEDEADIFMQFTGLHDKNGKEIFEGDILRLDSWEDKMQVAFIEGAFCLADVLGDWVGDIHYIHHAARPQASIIGNIYENPELLRKAA